MAQWYVHTAAGDRHGPIERELLDQWVEEGRITQNCQVWCEGWPDWQMAPEVFPQMNSEGQQAGQDQTANHPETPQAQPDAGSPFASGSGNRPLSSTPGSPGVQSPYAAQPQQSPAAQSPQSPYAAPTQPSFGHPGIGEIPSDPAGVTSLILGIISVVCVLFGCLFSCIGGFIVYPFVMLMAVAGLILGIMAKGNLRVAGIVLNIIALIPATIGLFALIIGLAAG